MPRLLFLSSGARKLHQTVISDFDAEQINNKLPTSCKWIGEIRGQIQAGKAWATNETRKKRNVSRNHTSRRPRISSGNEKKRRKWARTRGRVRREAKGDARRYAALLWRQTVRVRGRAGPRTPVPSSVVRFPHFERTSGSVLTFKKFKWGSLGRGLSRVWSLWFIFYHIFWNSRTSRPSFWTRFIPCTHILWC
jgi:hypothetical protein